MKFISERLQAVSQAWALRKAFFPGSGTTAQMASLIVGVILSVVALIIGLNMLPSAITAWVSVSNTTSANASAITMTGVGQIITVVVGIILAVGVILVVLKIAESTT